MLAQPELDNDYSRAGDMICPACGDTYLRHAVDPRARFLNVLCSGERVKL
jgi:hypothetical protein